MGKHYPRRNAPENLIPSILGSWVSKRYFLLMRDVLTKRLPSARKCWNWIPTSGAHITASQRYTSKKECLPRLSPRQARHANFLEVIRSLRRSKVMLSQNWAENPKQGRQSRSLRRRVTFSPIPWRWFITDWVNATKRWSCSSAAIASEIPE